MQQLAFTVQKHPSTVIVITFPRAYAQKKSALTHGRKFLAEIGDLLASELAQNESLSQ